MGMGAHIKAAQVWVSFVGRFLSLLPTLHITKAERGGLVNLLTQALNVILPTTESVGGCERYIDRSRDRKDQKKGRKMETEKRMVIFVPLLLLLLLLGTDLTMLGTGSLLNLSVSGGGGGSIEFEGGINQADGGGAAATTGGGCSSGEKVGESLLLEGGGGAGAEMGLLRSKGRVLWEGGPYSGRRYISYDALRGDNVPCNRPGIPYYNCHALPTANPYTRGCSVITGCARGD